MNLFALFLCIKLALLYAVWLRIFLNEYQQCCTCARDLTKDTLVLIGQSREKAQHHLGILTLNLLICRPELEPLCYKHCTWTQIILANKRHSVGVDPVV